MKDLFIDLETSSSVDLAKCGVYRYAEAEDFKILLFSYSVDSGPVGTVDLAHWENIPMEILSALTDRKVTKWAYNSAFERVCLSKFLGYPANTFIEPEQFRCVMTWGAYLGLPMSLAKISEVMHLQQGKLDTGERLIRKFCKPGSVIPMKDDPEWQLFCEYNRHDVLAEMEICNKLASWPVPEFVWEEFWDSERINDRGVAIDKVFVKNAIRISDAVTGEIQEELEKITGLENPHSVQQLKMWLQRQGVEADSLDKEAVASMLEKQELPDVVRMVLRLHQKVSRSSVAKYKKMMRSVNADGRVRGMFRFYGANRTGRFASRIVQLQNLPKNHMDDLDEARALVRAGDLKAVKAKYPDMQDVLSQLVRTAFIPGERTVCSAYARKGTSPTAPAAPSELNEGEESLSPKLLVADESSIEARVLAWFAGETWRIKAFADGKDIYCESASQMFHCTVVKNGENGHLRPKGKVAELALGYQGGVGALIKMGALREGLKENELQPIVDAWRAANPRIVKFWYDIGDAAMDAVKFHSTTKAHGLKFIWEKGFLFIELLSGKRLAYYGARVGTNQYGDCITYYGVGVNKQWMRLETSPGRLVENIIQATARDVLCYAIGNLGDRPVVMHVHDEIICEADGSLSLDQLCEIMGRTPQIGRAHV